VRGGAVRVCCGWAAVEDRTCAHGPVLLRRVSPQQRERGTRTHAHARMHNSLTHPPPTPRVQVTLEPYERDHAMVVGVFRAPTKKKD
jgi:hypothetical protein